MVQEFLQVIILKYKVTDSNKIIKRDIEILFGNSGFN